MRRVSIFFGCSLVVLLLSLSGCSTYQSLTSYFNTYYNASKLYESAVEEVDKSRGTERDTNYFALPEAAKTNEKFDKVIEKCSKLIQFYPKSALVDDAILMIGKAYVFKGEYESALREFNDLLNNFPNSDLRFETRLWSAKAEYYTKKPDESLKQLKDLVPDAHQDGDHDIEMEALALESQIFFERGEYGQAIETLTQAGGVSGDNDLRAQIQSQLGLCYERLGQYLKAADAYGAVRKCGSDFAHEVRARLKQAEMFSTAGEQQKALDVLTDLKQEPLKNDQIGLVDLGIADVYNAIGDTTRSFTMYNRIDTVYSHTEAAAKSCYQRGLICERDRRDYRAAYFYYDRASKMNVTSTITLIVQHKASAFSNYFIRRETVRQYDSLLVLALLADSAATDSFGIDGGMTTSSNDSLVVSHAKVMRKEPLGGPMMVQDNLKHQDVERSETSKGQMQPPQQGGPGGSGQKSRDDQQPPSQSDRNMGSGGKPGGGEHSQGDRITPNQGQRTSPDQFTLPVVNVNVPPKFPSDSIRSRIAQIELEIAGSFYLDFYLTDSALAWYQMVISDAPKSHYVPQALYAMADIHNGLHDSLAMDSLYRRIVRDYPSSEYAIQASKNLGLKATIEKDSTQEIAFQNSEILLQGGQVDSALHDMCKLAKHLDTTDVLTPKVFYTVGWIYENALMQNDSAAAWYKLLIKYYPNSIYASDVKDKIAVRDDPKRLAEYVKGKDTTAAGRNKNPLKKEPTAVNSESNDTDQDTDQQDEQVDQDRRQNTDDNSDEDQQDNDDDQSSDDSGG